MELLSSSTILGACGLAAALVVLLVNLLRFKVDPREPLVIYPSIPLVGHVIGMLTGGTIYMRKLAKKYKYPIFTLPLPASRTYIVTTPELCAAVQKASTAMSFDPIISQATPRLVGLNAHTADIIGKHVFEHDGPPSMIEKSHHIVNPPLMPNNVTEIYKNQLDYFGEAVAKIEDEIEVSLFRYVREIVTLASMATFFGPKNPFKEHPELLDSFWDWEAGSIAYMTGFLTNIFARKASRGLEACVKGFEEYAEKGGYEYSHKIIQDRYQFHHDQGITSKNEIARLEVGISLGVNINASNTTFWAVNHVFSRPELLYRIREEIRTNALVDRGAISACSLRQACPQLHSVYRETLRLYAPLTSARFVRDDTILAGKWLLRKNSVVQLQGCILHHDPEIWGPDVDSFNPDRFLYSMNGSKSLPDGTIPEGKAHFIHPAAFRSFGGGTSLCPGRHLAQMEIIGLLAILIMGFDIEPINGTKWDPPADVNRVLISVLKPTQPLDVRMKVRQEFRDVRWEIRE